MFSSPSKASKNCALQPFFCRPIVLALFSIIFVFAFPHSSFALSLVSSDPVVTTSPQIRVGQGQAQAVIQRGDAVVTGFSGTTQLRTPANANPVDYQAIDMQGVVLEVLDLSEMDGPDDDARLVAADKRFAIQAGEIGQVFGVALDDGTDNAGVKSAPNIYATATSAYGLQLLVETNTGPNRTKVGGADVQWMLGQFGEQAGGGPGAIWKIDGKTGEVALFANVTLNGLPNTGPALGNITFDPVSRNLYVSDLQTGMVHAFDLEGKEIAVFDHGVDGRSASGLTAVSHDPATRVAITSPTFRSDDPSTWGFASPERRVGGLAVYEKRLFYSVAIGPDIWSVGLNDDGTLAEDARLEIAVEAPAGDPVSDIVFSIDGTMYLAQRGQTLSAYDYSVLAEPNTASVLRYSRVKRKDGTMGWVSQASEYPVGFAGDNRNTNGGVALGFGYFPQGYMDIGSCEQTVWSTGEQLRLSPKNTTRLGSEQFIDGLQGNHRRFVKPANTPPFRSYYVDYDDIIMDQGHRGHMGDVAVWSECNSTVVADGTIDAGDIIGGTITLGSLTGGAITGGTVTGDTAIGVTVTNATVTGGTVVSVSIIGGKVSSGGGVTITGSKVTGGKISNVTITNITITNATVKGGVVSGGTVSGGSVTGGTVTAVGCFGGNFSGGGGGVTSGGGGTFNNNNITINQWTVGGYQPPAGPTSTLWVVPGQPNVRIKKECSVAAFGGTMKCTVSLINLGDAAPVGPVSFEDKLDIILGPPGANATFTSANFDPNFWTCSSFPSRSLKCGISGKDLQQWKRRSVDVIVDISNIAVRPGWKIENVATLSIDGTEAVAKVADDLVVAKSGPVYGPCRDDGICTFKITVTNNGPRIFTGNLQFTDDLVVSGSRPIGVSNAGIFPISACVNNTGGSLPLQMDCRMTLPARGGSKTIEVDLKFPKSAGNFGGPPPDARNCVVATSTSSTGAGVSPAATATLASLLSGPLPPPSPGKSCVDFQVQPAGPPNPPTVFPLPPILPSCTGVPTITPSITPATFVSAGQTITYKYTIENTTNCPLFAFRINESMPGLVQSSPPKCGPGVSSVPVPSLGTWWGSLPIGGKVDCSSTYMTKPPLMSVLQSVYLDILQ